MNKTEILWRKSFFVLLLISLLTVVIPAFASAGIDGDGIHDVYDNCAFTPNPDQLDLNGNNIGDVCEDYITLLSQSNFCTRLSETGTESSAQNCNNVTNRMEDGPSFDTIFAYKVMKSKGKYDVISFRSETDALQLSAITLSVWVNTLDSQWHPQSVRIYAYSSDADAIQSTTFLEFTLGYGWNVMDITSLLTSMEGFGFVKFRLVNVQKELRISEAYLRAPVPSDEPDISVIPTSLDYETIDVGTSSAMNLTVSNDGTADLVISTISNPTLPYSIISDLCSGQTLIPFASCSVTVEFAPTSDGTFNDSMTIPSNDSDSPSLPVILNGTATYPPLDDQEISVFPTSVEYQNVYIDQTSSLSFAISNIGTADLVIGTNTNPSPPYSIISDLCSGQTLIPSASCSVTVEFAPTVEGTFNDSMTIPSNDADNPNVTVTLNGTGAVQNTIEIIRPTDAYNPGDWIDVSNGYNGDLNTYSTKNTPNSTPSISFGGSSSSEITNAWQNRTNLWYSAMLFITFEKTYTSPSMDDLIELIVTNNVGLTKHIILSSTTAAAKQEFTQALNMSDWGGEFSDIGNLRLRINGKKKRGSDGAEARIYDIRIEGDATPLAPSDLTASAISPSQIDLSWTDTNISESGFKIERKQGIAGAYSEIATVGPNVTTYSDIVLLFSAEYYYRVRAYNGPFNSDYSNEVNPLILFSSQWTGGGTDNLASNPYNWLGNIVPPDGEHIVFDNTSVKDCTWDIDATPASMSINSGYTGTVMLNRNLSIQGNLSVVNGSLDLNDNSLNVDGNISISINGSLDATTSTITLIGNWSNQGSFSAGTSTILLNGLNQTIYGNSVFYNFIKIITSADILNFESGSTQTIINNLVLRGISGGLLTLRSTSDSIQWKIDPQGTRSVSFVDVTDSENVNSKNIVALDSVDLLNNTGWIFNNDQCL